MHSDILCIFAIPLTSFYDKLGEYAFEGTKKSLKRCLVFIICLSICLIFVVLNLIWFTGYLSWRIDPIFATWYELKEYIEFVLGVN